MENRNMIILVAAVVAVIAIIAAVFLSGALNGSDAAVTSPLETEFMEGKFVGNVTLVDGKEKFMHSFKDKEHNITYNISTVDNSSALMEIYEAQGVSNPEERSFNGNDWNIYFTQGVPDDNSSKSGSDNPLNIIICESQGEKQGYLIHMIIDGKSDVNASGGAFSEAYNDYVVPLLESITLKESSNVPKINEEYGMTEDQFAEQLDLLRQYKAGNFSALEG